jgi:hypothetical protein
LPTFDPLKRTRDLAQSGGLGNPAGEGSDGQNGEHGSSGGSILYGRHGDLLGFTSGEQDDPALSED